MFQSKQFLVFWEIVHNKFLEVLLPVMHQIEYIQYCSRTLFARWGRKSWRKFSIVRYSCKLYFRLLISLFYMYAWTILIVVDRYHWFIPLFSRGFGVLWSTGRFKIPSTRSNFKCDQHCKSIYRRKDSSHIKVTCQVTLIFHLFLILFSFFFSWVHSFNRPVDNTSYLNECQCFFADILQIWFEEQNRQKNEIGRRCDYISTLRGVHYKSKKFKQD